MEFRKKVNPTLIRQAHQTYIYFMSPHRGNIIIWLHYELDGNVELNKAVPGEFIRPSHGRRGINEIVLFANRVKFNSL